MSRDIEPKRIECMCPLCGNAHDARDISSPSAAAVSKPSDMQKARELLTEPFGVADLVDSETRERLDDAVAAALAAERDAGMRFALERIERAIAEFGDDANACANIIGEIVGESLHALRYRAASTAIAEQEPER